MEDILTRIKSYNIENSIWPSENAVIDRLLERSVEMQEVYDELSAKLNPRQQEFFWDALIGAAAQWNPDSSRELREKRRRLVKINQEISGAATRLAALIEERYELSETSGLSSYEDSRVIDWVDRAAEHNYRYKSYLREKLNLLSCQFDSKYWPHTFEVIAAISKFADEAEIYAGDPWTRELLASPKHSRADYLRVILKAIEDYKIHGPNTHVLPETFRVTDRSLATIVNCTLDLADDDLVSAEYIKRARQNIRELDARIDG